MIAEVFEEIYDAHGHKVFRPDFYRKGIHPTFPFGRYVSHPLGVKCDSLEDIRKFLAGCKQVKDQDNFGKPDYWQPPDEFEKLRSGDCDCFALWTWRQLLTLGMPARFVIGRAGSIPRGHAWVTFEDAGKTFLVEPTYAVLGIRMPRYFTTRYDPRFSVSWDGTKVSFFRHKKPAGSIPPLREFGYLVDWLGFWLFFWLTHGHRLVINPLRRRWRKMRGTTK
jgi:hypothetical protein